MTSPTSDRRQGLVGNTPIKVPVDCATTSNITLSGEQLIDGVQTAGSRVLVWQQTDATTNGIYNTSSAAWTRSADADGNYDLTTGTIVNVVGGTAFGGNFFQVTTPTPITIGTSVLAWIKALFSSSSVLSFIANAVGAIARSVQDKLRETISAFDFMTPVQIADVQARTRLLDVSVPMQNFFNACATKRGRMSGGDYLCNTPLIARQGMQIEGDGIGATVLVTTANINQVVNDPGGTFSVTMRDIQVLSAFPVADVAGPSTTATITAGSSDMVVASTTGMQKGIKIAGAGIPAGSYIRLINGTTVSLGNSAGAVVNATVTGAGVAITTTYRQGPTNFQFYLKNAGKWLLENMMFYTAFRDNDYSPLNAAGVWFDRDPVAGYFANTVSNCWFHHSQLLVGTSDSDIESNTIWSNPFDYALKLSAPGIRVSGGSVSAGVLQGLWVTATANEPSGASNHTINGVNFDAGSIWYTGYGARLDQPVGVVIAGGTRFNNIRKAAVTITDSTACYIDAKYLNNNQDGLAYSDVEVVSQTFQTTNLRITGVFQQTFSKAPTPGWAIREINLGFFPANNNYSGTSISAFYAASPINVSTPVSSGQYPVAFGLSGSSVPNVKGNILLETILNPAGVVPGQIAFGDSGLLQQISADVAANGTLDFPINLETFSSNPGGFAGTLSVSSTRANFVTQSRRTVYAAIAYGATGTFTSLASQDGSGGGSTFTITMFGNGNIRFTDTSGQATKVRMTFSGTKSAA